MSSEAAKRGLALWRERQEEARQAKIAELDVYRQSATTIERNGRTWTLVRIPDRYDEERKRGRAA